MPFFAPGVDQAPSLQGGAAVARTPASPQGCAALTFYPSAAIPDEAYCNGAAQVVGPRSALDLWARAVWENPRLVVAQIDDLLAPETEAGEIDVSGLIGPMGAGGTAAGALVRQAGKSSVGKTLLDGLAELLKQEPSTLKPLLERRLSQIMQNRLRDRETAELSAIGAVEEVQMAARVLKAVGNGTPMADDVEGFALDKLHAAALENGIRAVHAIRGLKEGAVRNMRATLVLFHLNTDASRTALHEILQMNGKAQSAQSLIIALAREQVTSIDRAAAKVGGALLETALTHTTWFKALLSPREKAVLRSIIKPMNSARRG